MRARGQELSIFHRTVSFYPPMNKGAVSPQPFLPVSFLGGEGQKARDRQTDRGTICPLPKCPQTAGVGACGSQGLKTPSWSPVRVVGTPLSEASPTSSHGAYQWDVEFGSAYGRQVASSLLHLPVFHSLPTCSSSTGVYPLLSLFPTLVLHCLHHFPPSQMF